MAGQYNFIFVVDDTIGSFANVDLMDVADIIVTSLSKYFNGFADVLASR
jgi:cystathionine gamma-synthase